MKYTYILLLLVALSSSMAVVAQNTHSSDMKSKKQPPRDHNSNPVTTSTYSTTTTTTTSDDNTGKKSDSATNANRDISNGEQKLESLLNRYHAVVYGIATILGAIFAFVGYKLFPATMFIAGASAGGIAAYILTDNTLSDNYTNKIACQIGVSCVCALVGGVLACKLRKLGVFLAGASGGVVGAIALNSTFLIKINGPAVVPQLYFYIAVVVLGSIAGVAALKLERLIIILATSAAGSFCATSGTKYFLELSGILPVPSLPTDGSPISSLLWAYLGFFMVIFLAGSMTQFCTTGKKKKKTSPVDERRTSLLSLDGQPSAPTEKYHTINLV